MEVVVAEEKKKIFRARKTMKISDRQQLESLHSTLLTAGPGLSDTSSPPLVNGTHKEDGQKMGDKEQNSIADSNSPRATSPASPAPFLSLNLSPSPASSQSPQNKEEAATSPASPFHSLNFELNKMEDDERDKKGSLSSASKESVEPASTESKESQEKNDKGIPEAEKTEEEQTSTVDLSVDFVKDSAKGPAPCSSGPSAVMDCIEPMDIDNNTTNAKVPDASTGKTKEEKPSSPKSTTSDSSPGTPSSSHPASSSHVDIKQEKEIKDEEKHKDNMKSGSNEEAKMEVTLVKVETKKEKTNGEKTTEPSRPSSTPPSTAVVKEEKGSASGLKRTLSEGYETEEPTVKREGKRPKVEREELEAQLELKITAKTGSHHKLEKIVQQIVDERLRVLEMTIFSKRFDELKTRVDKIDCATKHQTAINTLQAKIARLSKKFGEANQASENKRKQNEVLAAAAAASAAAVVAAAASKAATTTNSTQAQRPVRTSVEVKSTPTLSSSSTIAAPPVLQAPLVPAAVSAPAPTPTSTAIVQQAPILQLITSNSNAASNLATGITTQSPTGTLLLKTAHGSSMVAGQPLLIQLPLSMTNGQPGTLVNIPVSSLSAANSLTKPKTTASTATFILKPAPTITTASISAPSAATVSALQASASQMSPAQISLARAVYQGGAGGITTPNAGVSVTTARAPALSVSVAGAMSSASSPANSGPAATGSTAPGPPQGTSLTSKTDNQATGATPSKTAPPAARPKGSVIDLTEDDDDVQVTGVKSASVAAPSTTQRSLPAMSIPNAAGARSSPQSSQSSSTNPQLTVHHRPPLDSPLKSRTVNSSTPNRMSSIVLPPLPPAPAPPRLSQEAERSSPPQQPQLKLVPSQTGIVLSWCVAEADRTCAAVESYHLYAFHQDNSNTNPAQQHWKKIGEVKALPLPMACTLTQFQSGSTYHFAVRAKDIYGRFGSFCEPQCTNVINSSTT